MQFVQEWDEARTGVGRGSGLTVVYPVGPGERNESLRYSLRSVDRHIPGVRVIVAGHKPSWVTGVEHVHVSQARRAWSNVVQVLRVVCSSPVTPRRFVLLNDDFFALSPVGGFPLVHCGPLGRLGEWSGWSGGWYGEALANTRVLLGRSGCEEPLSYDRVHQPLPVVRDVLGKVLGGVGCSGVHRSFTATRWVVGFGGGCEDPGPQRKCSWWWVGFDGPGAWSGVAGRQIRDLFGSRCRFEWGEEAPPSRGCGVVGLSCGSG